MATFIDETGKTNSFVDEIIPVTSIAYRAAVDYRSHYTYQGLTFGGFADSAGNEADSNDLNQYEVIVDEFLLQDGIELELQDGTILLLQDSSGESWDDSTGVASSFVDITGS